MRHERASFLGVGARLAALAVIGAVIAAHVLAPRNLCALDARPQAGDPRASAPWEAPPEWAEKKNPFPSDAKSLEAGKAVFTKQCTVCHGPKGKGDGPAAPGLSPSPGDLSDPIMWKQSDGALHWKITEGRKSMPSYKNTLADEQRWHVVNYLRTFAPKPKPSP